jgi:hypothetical protein
MPEFRVTVPTRLLSFFDRIGDSRQVGSGPPPGKRAFTSPSGDDRLALASRRNRSGEEGSKNPMITTRKPVMSLYVDKGCPEHWIVRDREGRFWVVPSGENAWEKREPFHPSEDAELEPVPGHYMYMLGLPI